MRSRWTVGQLMWLILIVGVALGLLRSPLGEIVALSAGGVLGCGLAPWFACRALARFRDALPELDPMARRPALQAQAFVLAWSAWFFAGVVVAASGMVLARLLRP